MPGDPAELSLGRGGVIHSRGRADLAAMKSRSRAAGALVMFSSLWFLQRW